MYAIKQCSTETFSEGWKLLGGGRIYLIYWAAFIWLNTVYPLVKKKMRRTYGCHLLIIHQNTSTVLRGHLKISWRQYGSSHSVASHTLQCQLTTGWFYKDNSHIIKNNCSNFFSVKYTIGLRNTVPSSSATHPTTRCHIPEECSHK